MEPSSPMEPTETKKMTRPSLRMTMLRARKVKSAVISGVKDMWQFHKDLFLSPMRFLVYLVTFRWKWVLHGRSFDRWFASKVILLILAALLQYRYMPRRQSILHKPLITIAVVNRSPGNLTVWMEHEVKPKIFFHHKLFKESFRNVWENGVVQNATDVYMTLNPKDMRILTIFPKNYLYINSTYSPWPARLVAPVPEEKDNSFAVMIIDEKGELHMHDDKSIKAEITVANLQCHHLRKDDPNLNHETWAECLAANTFGGLPSTFSSSFWYSKIGSYEAWVRCQTTHSDSPMRTEVYNTTLGNKSVDIYSDEPLIAVMRDVLTEDICQEISKIFENVTVTKPKLWVERAKNLSPLPKHWYPKSGTVHALTDIESTAKKYAYAKIHNLSLSEKYAAMFEAQTYTKWQDVLSQASMVDPRDVHKFGVQRRVTWFAFCGVAKEGGELLLESQTYKVKPQTGDLIAYQLLYPHNSSTGVCPIKDGEHRLVSQFFHSTATADELLEKRIARPTAPTGSLWLYNLSPMMSQFVTTLNYGLFLINQAVFAKYYEYDEYDENQTFSDEELLGDGSAEL